MKQNRSKPYSFEVLLVEEAAKLKAQARLLPPGSQLRRPFAEGAPDQHGCAPERVVAISWTSIARMKDLTERISNDH
jgi:hypothetical protein